MNAGYRQDRVPDTDLLSIEEASRGLHVSPTTVWRLIRDGSLPAVRIGKKLLRVRRADLSSIVSPASAQPASQPVVSDERLQPPPISTPEELARRREVGERMRKLREEIGPIDISVRDLIEDGRRR